MLLFCPSCSNCLTVSTTTVRTTPSSTRSGTPASQNQNQNQNASNQSSSNQEVDMVNCLECQTCPYQYVIKKSFYDRKVFKRVEREDVFGGPGAWDNAQKIGIRCDDRECNGLEAAYFEMQIRSADEPMTMFYKCMTCGCRWRDG